MGTLIAIVFAVLVGAIRIMGTDVALAKPRSLREAWRARQHSEIASAAGGDRAKPLQVVVAGGAGFAAASYVVLDILPDELMEAERLFWDVLPYGLCVLLLLLAIAAIRLRGVQRYWPILLELVLVGAIALIGSGYYLARTANRWFDVRAPHLVEYASGTAISRRPKNRTYYYVSLERPREFGWPSIRDLRVPVERTSTIAGIRPAMMGARALGPVRAWVGQGALGYRWLVRLEPAVQADQH